MFACAINFCWSCRIIWSTPTAFKKKNNLHNFFILRFFLICYSTIIIWRVHSFFFVSWLAQKATKRWPDLHFMLAQKDIKVNFRLCRRWGGRERHFSDNKSEREKATSKFLTLVRSDLQVVVDLSRELIFSLFSLSALLNVTLGCFVGFYSLLSQRELFICMFNE